MLISLNTVIATLASFIRQPWEGKGLQGADACWISNEECMLKIASDYFQHLFAASTVGDDERVLRLVQCLLHIL